MNNNIPEPTTNSEDITEQTLLEQMGGVTGIVSSTLPLLVYVPANAFYGLQPALWAALVVALGIFLWRLVRKDSLMPAISGFFGVAICAFIAWKTGDAKGYYAYGIWYSLVSGIVFLISIALKYPLVGLSWNYLNGRPQTWRTIPAARRPVALATFVWAVLFFARFAIKQFLYVQSDANILGFVTFIMGWPLTALALLVCVWAIKKSDEVVKEHVTEEFTEVAQDNTQELHKHTSELHIESDVATTTQENT